MEPDPDEAADAEDLEFKERRGEIRYRALKGGTLTFDDGRVALECVVRNLSANGARIAMGDTTSVPARFDLVISGDDRVRDAHVRWRAPTVIGVELDPPVPEEVKPDVGGSEEGSPAL